MRTKKRFVLAAVAGAMLVMGLASGCAAGKPPTSQPSKTEIMLGALTSTTGANVADAAVQKWAYEQAVKDINARGGVNVGGRKMTLRLVFEDDRGTADGARAAMERLVKVDNVDLCLGSNVGAINEAAAAVADEYGMFLAIGAGLVDLIRPHGFKMVAAIGPESRAVGRNPFEVWGTMPVVERPTRIAVLTEDDADGRALADDVDFLAQKYSAVGLHYTIVSRDVYSPGTKDYSANIEKIKLSGANALLWLGSQPDGIGLVRQIKAQRLSLKYLQGWNGFRDIQFARTLARDADYIVHDGFWADVLPYPGGKELGDKFRADHDGVDSVSIGLPYASVQVVAQAIERAGWYASAQVRDEVRGATFKGTVMGDLTFSGGGICVTPLLAMQWIDGKRVPVWPPVPAYRLEWMRPWDRR